MKKKPRIVIDPGHGGYDSGAINGSTNLLEKDVALDVSRRLKNELEYFFEVALTRENDSFVPLGRRAQMANSLNAPLLSIHCNAGGGKGFEAFTSKGKTESDAWATRLLLEYGFAFPGRRLRADFADGDPDKEARFAVLTKTNKPAVLFELAFIDTYAGASFLSDKTNKELMAKSLAQATINHFDVDREEEATDALKEALKEARVKLKAATAILDAVIESR